MTDRLLYRPSEAAEALSTSRSKVYVMLQRGELPKVYVGACLRVPRAALEEWIARQLREQTEAAVR